MPAYMIHCPICDRTFQGFVLAGTREPEKWVCSKCGEDKAVRLRTASLDHPLEAAHGVGCLCCGGQPKPES